MRFYIRRERTSLNFAEFWATCPPKFADFASIDKSAHNKSLRFSFLK